MSLQDAHGYFLCNINLKLNIFYNLLLLLLILNFLPKLKPSGLTMGLGFFSCCRTQTLTHSHVARALLFQSHLLISLWAMSTSLIAYHEHSYPPSHLLRCYTTAHHPLITWKYLVVYIMQLLFILLTNLILVPNAASLLDTLCQTLLWFRLGRLLNH